MVESIDLTYTEFAVDLPVLRMQQSDATLYLTQMTAGQLISCTHTEEWNPELGWDIEHQGFQRAPVQRHYQAIGHFLKESANPFIPTAALLSAAEDRQGILPFRRMGSRDGSPFGVLTIPEGRQLLILDYQHREKGLRFAMEELGASHLADFTMPVVIVPNIPRFEEIRQFYLINSKQRRIDTDLALALLQTLAGHVEERELRNLVGPGKTFRIRATRLTFQLAERTKGPWAGRIAQPHDLPQPNAVIKIKSFVDSLATVVSPRWSCSQLDDNELLDVLSAFWSALAAILPVPFKDPVGFQTQKTVGVFAFHLVFARRVYPNCEAAGKISRKAFQDELSPAIADFINEEFWPTNGPAKVYVGSSGYRELAKLIMDKIPARI